MTNLTRLTVLLALLVLIGCGGSDDPGAPTPPVPPLVAGTIGGEGGELAAPDIALIIPPGALVTNTEMSIYADSDDSPFGAGTTPTYRLEGLPEEFAAPITLRLRHDVARADSVVVFLGEERESYEGGRGLTWFDVATRDSAGWSVADLSRGPYVLDSEKAEPSLKVSVAEGMAWSPTSGGHFRVIYDPQRLTAGQIALVSAKLEVAWNEVYDLGFRFGGQDIWPRPVYLRDLDHLGRLAQYTTAPFGRGHFTIDPDALDNALIMGIVVGHEVFHCAQDFYDTRPPSDWKTLNYKRLCLDEATASWFEGKFYPDSDSHPLSMNHTYYSMPLNSFAGLRNFTIAETGYGLSSMVKYIVDSQGEGRILEMYNQFTDVGFTEDAIQDVVDPVMSEWIVDFHHRQVTSQNFQYLEPGEFWFDLPNNGELVGGTTPSYSTVMKLWEMGANVTVFTVQDERLEPAPFLKARSETSEPVQMSIFGMESGQHPVLLGTALDSVRIEGLPDLTEQYDKFMAMGIRIEEYNPNLAAAIYPFPVVTLEEDELAGFETAYIRVVSNGQYAQGVEPFMSVSMETDFGRVVGNTYHAAWDSVRTSSNVRYSGHLTLVFDLETMNVESWSGASTIYQPDTLTRSTRTIGGSGMALVYNGGDEFRYGGLAAETCGAMTYQTFTRHVDDKLVDWLESWSCDDNSHVALALKNEL